MLTYRITALGRVQGVGFRPLICRLAGKHHITGTVRNEGGVVTIIAQGSREALLSFMGDIQAARRAEGLSYSFSQCRRVDPSCALYRPRGRLWRSRNCVRRKYPMRLCPISVRS